MERALRKLAKQLEGLDEASLMSLWPKYADAVRKFEPSRRWEEDTLILCLLQAVRFKNQLFNYHWAENAGGLPPERQEPLVRPDPGEAGAPPGDAAPDSGDTQQDRSGARGKVLAFPGAKPGK